MSAFVSRLWRQNLTFGFAVEFADSHPDLAPNVPVEDGDLIAFRQYLRAQDFDFEDVADK